MKKLRYMIKELFRVTRNIKNFVYELQISDFNIHNVFITDLLTKVDFLTLYTKALSVKQKEEI